MNQGDKGVRGERCEQSSGGGGSKKEGDIPLDFSEPEALGRLTYSPEG